MRRKTALITASEASGVQSGQISQPAADGEETDVRALYVRTAQEPLASEQVHELGANRGGEHHNARPDTFASLSISM
jgi:hypothetical protein